MKEDFLHFIWQNKRFKITDLISEQNQKIEIVRFGDYFELAGPDIFNAQLYIDNQLWAGNIEIHLKASDWYSHKHESDKNYENVILHVVWEYDIDIFRKDGSVIPVLNLSKIVNENVLKNYLQLKTSKNWIYCENDIDKIDDFTWLIWKEKLLIERLEKKSEPIDYLLKKTKNNWNEVLFILLTKNFGLNINGSAFEETAKIISYKILNKEKHISFNLEALFFGISGLLNEQKQDVYFNELKTEFEYLQEKHLLKSQISENIHFFKLRPDNFPTIRFSQLAQLLHKKSHLFSDVIQETFPLKKKEDYFSISVSEYWKTHYVFDKENKSSNKKISSNFIDLLFLNTFFPLRFVYLKSIGKTDFDEIIDNYQNIKSEKNAILDKFKSLNIKVENALDSQSLIHLKKNYCEAKKCLNCMIGLKLLKNIV